MSGLNLKKYRTSISFFIYASRAESAEKYNYSCIWFIDYKLSSNIDGAKKRQHCNLHRSGKVHSSHISSLIVGHTWKMCVCEWACNENWEKKFYNNSTSFCWKKSFRSLFPLRFRLLPNTLFFGVKSKSMSCFEKAAEYALIKSERFRKFLLAEKFSNPPFDSTQERFTNHTAWHIFIWFILPSFTHLCTCGSFLVTYASSYFLLFDHGFRCRCSTFWLT